MRDADDLVRACEDYFVLSDDRSAANRVNTYLTLLARLAHAVAVVDIFALFALVGNRICDHKSRSARRVELFVVVLLDDLDIEINAERASRLASEIYEQIYADREISRVEYSHLVSA